MKILVWKGYGEIDVFCAETTNQLDEIYRVVVANLQDFATYEEYVRLTTLYKSIKNGAGSRSKKEGLINELVDLYGMCLDSFETFYFTTVEYP